MTLPSLSSGLSAAVNAVPGLSSLASTTAGAANPALSCAAPDIYNVTTGGNLYELNYNTGANTAAAPSKIGTGNVNALGVAPGGTTAYTANMTVSGSGSSATTTVSVENITAGTGTNYAGQTAANASEIIAGGVNPVNQDYYYGGWNSAENALYLFVFNPTTHTSSEIGYISPPSGLSYDYGDVTFDGEGDLTVLAGSTSNSAKLFNVAAANVPSSGTAALPYTTLTTITASQTEQYVGIAFAADSTLYVETIQGALYAVNPSTGAIEAGYPISQTGLSGTPSDLGACTYNGSLTVQKDIVGRVAPGDQFTMTITGGGLSSGNTGTTTGSSTGLQTGAGEVAGPVVGLPSTTYDVAETAAGGANLSNYSTTWSCLNGSTSFSSGTGTTFSVTFPTPSGSTGAQIVCTFTNTPATLSITKASPTASFSAVGNTISYTYTVKNTGPLTLTNVGVTDNPIAPAGALTSGPTCQSVTTPPGTCSGNSITLTSGESATFTGTYTVTQADLNNGSVNDTSTATGTAPGSGTVTATSNEVTVPAVQNPALTILKTQSGGPNPLTAAGQVVTYSFAVTNSGNVTLSNVSVNDVGTAPAGDVTATCTGLTNPTGTCSGTTVASLAPGQVATFTGSYTVTQADIDHGAVADSATATGTKPGGGTSTSPPSTVSIPVTRTSTLGIVKAQSAGPNPVTAAGQVVTYSFTVTNTGNTTETNVSVTDTGAPPTGSLASGPTCTGLTNPTGTCSGGTVATLAPGQVATFTGTYTVSQADIDNGSVNDSAVAKGTAPTGPVTSSPSSVSIPVTQTATLTILKSQTNGPNPVTAVGQVVTYQFVVTNTGNTTETDVSVTDTGTAPAGSLTSGPTCTGLTNPTGTCSGGTVASLAPGQVATFTGTYTVTQADLDNGSVTDTGVAHGTSPKGPVTSPGSSVTIGATQSPALTTLKTQTSGPDPITAAGQVVGYTFTVTNSGNVTLTNVSVDDTATPPATAVTADCVSLSNPAGTCSGPTVASLAPGQVATFTGSYTVTQADIDHGSVTDTAMATGTTPAGGSTTSPGSTVTIPVTQTSTLGIVKSQSAGPNPITASGQVVTYQFVVTNTGNTTLSDVSVDDVGTAPAGDVTADCVSLSNPAGTCSGATVSSLAPGQVATFSGTYTVSQADVDNGSVTDTGTASGTAPSGGPVTSAPSSVTIGVTQSPGLTTLKTQTSGPNPITAAGQVVGYTFTVTNSGNVTLTNVSVDDTATPPATAVTADCVSLSNPAGTCSGPTVASLAPGQVATFTGSYTVTQADIDHGSVADSATATGTTPGGSPSTSPPSTVTIPVTQTSTLGIVKSQSAGPNPITASGQVVTYQFVVTNTGNTTLSEVSVDDVGTAPAGDVTADCVSLSNPAGTCSGGTVASLAPGQVATFTGTYTVSQADVDNGSVTDTGTASGTAPSGGPVTSAPSSVTIGVTQSPAVKVVKTADVSTVSAVGEVVTYTFAISNTGNVTLTNVDVSDAQAAPSLDSSLGPITCTSGTNGSITLAPDATDSCSATYTVTQADITNGSIDDTATVSGDPPNSSTPVTGTSSLSLSVTQVTVTKAASPSGGVVAGSSTPIVYTITVKNVGTATTTDPIVVSDAAPTGTTLVSGSPACATGGPPACSVSVSGGTITWTIPSGVAAGASYTLTFSVTANASDATGTITNTAVWSGPSCGAPVTTATAAKPSATTAITCQSDPVSTPVTAAPVTTSATTPTTSTTTTTAAPVTSPSTTPAIAFTGAMLSEEWTVGLAALVLGAGLVTVARRRRRRPKHAASRR